VFHIRRIDFHWFHFLVLQSLPPLEMVNENGSFSIASMLVELNDVFDFHVSFYYYQHFSR
jgi:hypothetical protein